MNISEPVSRVEVEHHCQGRSGVPAKHVYQRRPLAGGNRGERVREELPAPHGPGLAVKSAESDCQLPSGLSRSSSACPISWHITSGAGDGLLPTMTLPSP